MRLDEALRALREESANVEAPERVEQNLMAAFRARKKKRSVVPWVTLAMAAAAGLVMALILSRPPEPVKMAVAVRAPQVVEVPVPRALKTPVAQKVRRVVNRPAAAPQAPLEAWSDFVPVPYAPPMNAQEGGQVLRVRLPRATLQSFGFPMPVDRAFDRLNAEVMVGQDGVVRAIRFAK